MYDENHVTNKRRKPKHDIVEKQKNPTLQYWYKNALGAPQED